MKPNASSSCIRSYTVECYVHPIVCSKNVLKTSKEFRSCLLHLHLVVVFHIHIPEIILKKNCFAFDSLNVRWKRCDLSCSKLFHSCHCLASFSPLFVNAKSRFYLQTVCTDKNRCMLSERSMSKSMYNII